MANLLVGGSQPTEARQGRHKQRYGEDGERLVAGCIPIRVISSKKPNECDLSPEDVEVLLVSSRGGKGFCLPKGGWEDDESVENAARRETVEEAGVRGTIEEPMLGTFPFSSGKTSQDTVHKGRCIAHVYVMHVVEELEIWPEGHERQRVWYPLIQASAQCRYDWMRQAIDLWVERKGWTMRIDEAQQALKISAASSVGQSSAVAIMSVSSDMSELSDTTESSGRQPGGGGAVDIPVHVDTTR